MVNIKKLKNNEIDELKKKLGVKCECNSAICWKCLSDCCKDNNCPVHTKELKEKWRAKNAKYMESIKGGP